MSGSKWKWPVGIVVAAGVIAAMSTTADATRLFTQGRNVVETGTAVVVVVAGGTGPTFSQTLEEAKSVKVAPIGQKQPGKPGTGGVQKLCPDGSVQQKNAKTGGLIPCA